LHGQSSQEADKKLELESEQNKKDATRHKNGLDRKFSPRQPKKLGSKPTPEERPRSKGSGRWKKNLKLGGERVQNKSGERKEPFCHAGAAGRRSSRKKKYGLLFWEGDGGEDYRCH